MPDRQPPTADWLFVNGSQIPVQPPQNRRLPRGGAEARRQATSLPLSLPEAARGEADLSVGQGNRSAFPPTTHSRCCDTFPSGTARSALSSTRTTPGGFSCLRCLQPKSCGPRAIFLILSGQ